MLGNSYIHVDKAIVKVIFILGLEIYFNGFKKLVLKRKQSIEYHCITLHLHKEDIAGYLSRV